MNPKVKDYLLNKYPNLQSNDGYDQALKAQEEMSKGLNIAEGLASLGDSLQGRAGASDAYFANVRKRNHDSTIGAYENKVANEQKALQNENLFTDTARKLSLSDANSPESISFRKTVETLYPNYANEIKRNMGDNYDLITAADKDSIFDVIKLRENTEARKLERELQNRNFNERALDRAALNQEKKIEKEFQLKTPFGLANTPDDAKQLKEAYESKMNFDGKLNDLIALREKHGGELLNREAVARGKQLSKDLLLEYKNMAKLGVLSKSDEDIINAIIPEDPLSFSLMPGQDPVMENLKNFKKDSDRDFQTRIQTRTREPQIKKEVPIPQSKDTAAPSKSTQGKDKVRYQDGHTFYLNEETGEYE